MEFSSYSVIRIPLDDIVADNAERNTEFMKLYFDNTEFQKAIKEAARKRAYRIITDPARDEALARLRAEMARETGGRHEVLQYVRPVLAGDALHAATGAEASWRA
jgi:hypothetical protein